MSNSHSGRRSPLINKLLIHLLIASPLTQTAMLKNVASALSTSCRLNGLRSVGPSRTTRHPHFSIHRTMKVFTSPSAILKSQRWSETEGENSDDRKRPSASSARRSFKPDFQPNLNPSPPKASDFRNNFRGTRVFVQNIPDGVSWQDLKDHFRVCGNVVFASVSVTAGGASKGCGVVQYETTEEAAKAIKSMRDHPMDGVALYVREDVQESQDADRVLGPRSERGQRLHKSSWKCANDEENAGDLIGGEDRGKVESILIARDAARRRKNYDASDSMREELKSQYGVYLDDRLKFWWIDQFGDKQPPDKIKEANGEGHWDSPAVRTSRAPQPWKQIRTNPGLDSCVNPDMIHALLKQRDIARLEKDFGTADKLLEEATYSPDGEGMELRIHDESRTWRIWTTEPPQKPIVQETVKGPVEECMELVMEHEPEKVDEVKLLLSKFPGREYNILKKLRQRFADKKE